MADFLSKKFSELHEVTEVADENLLLVHNGSGMRTIQKQNVNIGGGGGGGGTVPACAEAHNAIFRGQSLGTSVTAAQLSQIDAGTFDDLFIGDYWEISGITYRIAAFDYYLNTGGTACTKHHVTIVPDQILDSGKRMEATAITTNGYYGSEMYTTNMATAKSTINTAFSGLILSHKMYLTNKSASGFPSGASEYDSTIELMCENNVYGTGILGAEGNGTYHNFYTYDKTQFPLFYLDPKYIVALDTSGNRQTYWLRDIVSSTYFACVYTNGYAYASSASNYYGVRPRFSICKNS